MAELSYWLKMFPPTFYILLNMGCNEVVDMKIKIIFNVMKHSSAV